MEAVAPPLGSSSGESLRLSWVQPNGLLSLSFANFVLRILTLGIYNFWAKTETRRRVWSAVRVDGEPLSYTGTGKELFLGFLVIMAVIFVPVMLLSIGVVVLFGPQSPALGIFQMALYATFFFLTGVAIYRAQRYRLSRTTWRGIRGSIDGGSWQYGWTYFWTLVAPFAAAFLASGLVLTAFAMGESSVLAKSFAAQDYATSFGVILLTLLPLAAASWIFPWRATKLQNFITNDMRFGDRPFRSNALPGPLYGPFAVFWIGVLVIAVGSLMALGGTLGGLAVFAAAGAQPDPSSPPDMQKIIGLLAVVYGVLAIAFLFYYLLSAWYRARQINHFAKHTHFEDARFQSAVTGSGLVWIALGNFLLRMAGLLLGVIIIGLFFVAIGAVSGPGTFDALGQPDPNAAPGPLAHAAIFGSIVVLAASAGLFGPIIQARSARYLVENLSIEGRVPLAAIKQGIDQGIRRGEGLAQAFDVDAF